MKAITTYLVIASIAPALYAEDAELAQKLANPVAALVSLPVEGNFEFGVGLSDGTRWTTNNQPVIPLELNGEWNLISRTILPLIDQNGILPGGAADSVSMENSYDWTGNNWSLPVNFVISPLISIGDQPVQFFGGARYYLESPAGGPEWGLRFGSTFLFSKI